MRLINTQTLQLHFFMENAIPFYAILSHTWENDEVSFQEMSNPVLDSTTTQKQGYAKIKNCCAVALRDGYEFVWVDTCCIDKTSSAELSEAINSMYNWYEKAEVCYAYIADYALGTQKGVPEESFKRSKWFTRGWTLQELLAPEDVIFLNGTWQELGTKSSLRALISDVTGIHVAALLGNRLKWFSVAQKMSWASKRQTTRSEDMAYCLMGLFQVNMPMLYGEGDRAFIRLQETIMMRSTDHTIFAWGSSSNFPIAGEFMAGATPVIPEAYRRGLLAGSPSCFMYSSNIVAFRLARELPFSVTNAGVQISVFICRDPTTNKDLAILDCTYDEDPTQFLALCLKPFPGKGDRYYVDWISRITTVPNTERKRETVRNIFITDLDFKSSAPDLDHRGLHIDTSALKEFFLDTILPHNHYPSENFVYFPPLTAQSGIVAALVFRRPLGGSFAVTVYKASSGSGLLEIDISETGFGIRFSKALEDFATDGPLGKFPDDCDVRSDRKYCMFWANGWWCISAGLKKRVLNGRKVIVLVVQDGPSEPPRRY